MNCHYCGTQLKDGASFCLHCGTRQQSAPQTEIEEIPAANIPVQEELPVQTEVAAVPESSCTTIYKEKPIDWLPYGAPEKEAPLVELRSQVSALQLPVKRSLWKMILFGLLPLGIYPVVIWSRLVTEVNLVASRHDGERSMPFFGMVLLSPLTMGIHSLVWCNKLFRRIGKELQRRNVTFAFGPRDFWLWAFLMSFLSGVCFSICGVLLSLRFDVYIVIWLLLVVAFATLIGPFVFTAKLMKAMNLLNGDYNTNG